MTEIFFAPSYEKKVKSFIKKHPEIKVRYKRTLEMLSIDPHHPSLKLHKLKGPLFEFSAVSINYTYRIVLTFVMGKNGILLIDIGTHDEVYR